MVFDSERRMNERFPIRIPVDCGCKDNFLIEYSSNISQNGIFITSENPHPPGTNLELVFTDTTGTSMKIKGSVIWINARKDANSKPGMGIQFMDLSDRDKERLLQLVKRIAVLE